MATILVMNGPNLNLLGKREPEIYGTASLDEINYKLSNMAQSASHELMTFQSNAEHELIAKVHTAMEQVCAFIIINPAAFTHTSIALRDALAGSKIPFIEVHLSNIFAREQFRRQSYFSDLAQGVISGLGAVGYELAVTAACHFLTNKKF